LRLVDSIKEHEGEFEIKVDDKNHKKGKIMGTYETIVDIRFLKVTSDEIRISRISGYISMIDILIEPLPAEEDKLPKSEFSKSKLMLETFINCPTKDDNLNCIFEPNQLPDVICEGDGIIAKVPYDEDEKIACKFKCQKKCTGYLKDSNECTGGKQGEGDGGEKGLENSSENGGDKKDGADGSGDKDGDSNGDGEEDGSGDKDGDSSGDGEEDGSGDGDKDKDKDIFE